jgi:starch synthase (maltosyl-transferring)
MLKKLAAVLRKNKPSYPLNYTIPSLLNYKDQGKNVGNGEILINPYDFYSILIEDLFLSKKDNNVNYLESISNSKGLTRRTNWHKKSVFYSLMARTSTTWDNDRSGEIDESNLYDLSELGSFVKSIALLPYLKSIGVDVLYFLPLSSYSTYRSKGDLGSSYAVVNFTELDENLKDSLTGNKMTLKEEFKAFVEAAHILEIRIMIDIIPRTNALDSSLILDHPDWFYWINTKDLSKYNPPLIDTIDAQVVPPHAKHMPKVYEHENTKNHLKLFKDNPYSLNPSKWDEVRKLVKGGMNILDAVNQVYKMTVAPAFSDHINDTQPPWYDVTFFRLYLDHPVNAQKYLKKNQPPYILFDTIKSNLHPGLEPNMPLWELLADIIPYYQREFGIDGARIDMGHALPQELIEMIISKAREIDQDFVFVAEELDPSNARKAKKLGYDAIIGNGFWMESRILEGKLHEFIKSAPKLALPAFACGETHDTPRLAGKHNGVNLTNLLTLVNFFIPNTMPFINSGQEFYEVQPMNLGIDATPEDRYHLPESDPFYGKLALFDKYALHYQNDHSLVNHIRKILPVRNKYLSKLNPKKFHMFNVLGPYIGLAFGYTFKSKGEDKLLLVVANTNTSYEEYMEVKLNLKNNKLAPKLKVLFEFDRSDDEANVNDFSLNGNPFFLVGPGEVKIILIG